MDSLELKYKNARRRITKYTHRYRLTTKLLTALIGVHDFVPASWLENSRIGTRYWSPLMRFGFVAGMQLQRSLILVVKDVGNDL